MVKIIIGLVLLLFSSVVRHSNLCVMPYDTSAIITTLATICFAFGLDENIKSKK